MKMILFMFPALLVAQTFPQKFSCVSVIDSKIDQQEVELNEYAMANIYFVKGDWSYTADVIENRLNSLTVENISLGSKASAHSVNSNIRHLHVRLDARNAYSTVDCELKF
jgi:hypothetical protein